MLKALCIGQDIKDILLKDPKTKDQMLAYEESTATYYVAPAYLDLQVNGYAQVTLDEGYSEDALLYMSDAMRRDGTSMFVPTVITCTRDYMAQVLKITSDFMAKFPGRIPGVHLEGPFISQGRAGIHQASLIRVMAEEDLELLLKYRKAISYITCSPESVPPLMRKALIDAGIKLSLGHSTADFKAADEFLKAGATLGTHLYNAMTKAYNGRTPGCVEALLLNKTFTGVICDGVHVAWPLVQLAHQILGRNFVLVTDALAAAGVKDPTTFPEFNFAGTKIFNDPVRGCIDSNGTLGGSRLVMAQGVRNLVNELGLSLEDAVYAGAISPYGALRLCPLPYINVLDDKLNVVAPSILAPV